MLSAMSVCQRALSSIRVRICCCKRSEAIVIRVSLLAAAGCEPNIAHLEAIITGRPVSLPGWGLSRPSGNGQKPLSCSFDFQLDNRLLKCPAIGLGHLVRQEGFTGLLPDLIDEKLLRVFNVPMECCIQKRVLISQHIKHFLQLLLEQRSGISLHAKPNDQDDLVSH